MTDTINLCRFIFAAKSSAGLVCSSEQIVQIFTNSTSLRRQASKQKVTKTLTKVLEQHACRVSLSLSRVSIYSSTEILLWLRYTHRVMVNLNILMTIFTEQFWWKFDDTLFSASISDLVTIFCFVFCLVSQLWQTKSSLILRVKLKLGLKTISKNEQTLMIIT